MSGGPNATYRNSVIHQPVGQAVLLDTLDRWHRLRPLRRAELAAGAYHRGVDEVFRRLPTSTEGIGADVLATTEGRALRTGAIVRGRGLLTGWRGAIVQPVVTPATF